eukprot:scaffold1808_cov158-Amphora_coffeaeformis.AAC.6
MVRSLFLIGTGRMRNMGIVPELLVVNSNMILHTSRRMTRRLGWSGLSSKSKFREINNYGIEEPVWARCLCFRVSINAEDDGQLLLYFAQC